MSANDAKPTGGENKEVAKKRINSPNIKSAADEVMAEPQLSEEEARRKAKETVAIDGIPIDEKDIKFHAKDIKEADTGKLFVKVEGAEERKKAIVRDIERQKAELIRKENEQKRNAERANQRTIRRQKRDNFSFKLRENRKKIITCAILALVVLALVTVSVCFIVKFVQRRQEIQATIDHGQKISESTLDSAKADQIFLDDGYQAGFDAYQRLIDEAKTNEVKSDLYYHRAKTICEMFGGSVYLEQALSDAYAAESLDSRNIVVLELISRLEAENGNQEKAKQYQEKFEQKLTEQAEVGGGKG